jgi:hypothetical protein
MNVTPVDKDYDTGSGKSTKGGPKLAGSPKKRALKEQAAQKRLEVLARQQADEKALKLPRRVRYTSRLGEEIKALIAAGIPIEDSVLNGAVISPGVATRLGVSSRSIWDWQK